MPEISETAAPAFGDWAGLYRRFRPAYPPALYARLEAAVADARGACIELGAGSGQATRTLAELFERVDAVEPDPAMLAHMPAQPGVRVHACAAEDAVFTQGCADAVVVATAFHWMDQHLVAKRAAGWLRPGGVFFVFGYGAGQYPGAPAAISDVVARYARSWRRHTHDRLVSWRAYAELLEQSGAFACVEAVELYADHVWTPHQLAGFLMSTSYGQAFARATGDADAALASLAGELDGAARGRKIWVRFPLETAYGRTSGVSSK